MRTLIATDAWRPQVNGVVRTLEKVLEGLQGKGQDVAMLTPQGRKTLGLPGYSEIPLTWISQKAIAREISAFAPDSIHIATEGPIGHAVRKWCLHNDFAFTTSYHTRFAEYLSLRLPLPGVEKLAYAILRRFHAPSKRVLVPTAGITRDLEQRGFAKVVTWTRGVDHQLFRPLENPPCKAIQVNKPVLVYVGRVAVEKGLEDFLKVDVPGTKLVIGDGPSRKDLQARYPDAQFVGYKHGEELVSAMGKGDVFVFPSRTDTFGLVMLEAMACGMPVAAYPVTGPIDVVEDGVSGALDENLSVAIMRARCLKTEDAIARAQQFTWHKTVDQFVDNLVAARL